MTDEKMFDCCPQCSSTDRWVDDWQACGTCGFGTRAYEAARPDHVMVPREPTEAMLKHGAARLRDFYSESGHYPRTKALYKSMIAAHEQKTDDT